MLYGKRALPCLMALALYYACFSGYALAGDAPLNLTLKQAVGMAVEKNLEVRAELYNPAMYEAEVRKNRGIYDPLLNLFTNYQHSTTQSENSLLSGGNRRQKNYQANAGVSQLVPVGGTVGLAFENLWNNNNFDTTRALNEYWRSQLTLSYTQPLLKNFGRDATELGIAVALNNKEVSLEEFQGKLMDVVARTRTAYYTLFSLRENLEAKKNALKLAEKILEETKGRVRAGVLPAMEILNAEYGVSLREKELIDAEKSVRDQTDVVRNLLQIDGSKEVVPLDPPDRTEYPVKEDEAISSALERRPDLLAMRTNIRTADLQTRVAHNRIMPDLVFVGSAALTGLGRDYGRDMEKIGTAEYPVWEVGLRFSYPIGNRDAKNSYIKSRLNSEQARVRLKNMEDTIRNEVKIAVRGIRASYLQLNVADRGYLYAEERLRAYIKKNEVGLATTKEVIDVQNDLISARTNQIKARAEYTIAIGHLWKVTGELLEREGIALEVRKADALYEENSR